MSRSKRARPWRDKTILTPEIVEAVRATFRLDWRGIHGAAHWARVRENGLRLATVTGAHRGVVEVFAFVHDVARHHDGSDPDHGERAVDFARGLRGTSIRLADDEFGLLEEACRSHSRGLVDADVTVQTCWDADRLDLGRVGIRPDPVLLCTPAARAPETIAWAYERSRRWRLQHRW